MSTVRYRLQGLHFGLLVILIYSADGVVLHDGGAAWGSVWESYSAATSRPAAAAPQAVPRTPGQTGRQSSVAVDDPRYHAISFFGFPRRQDPLFDETSKPSWRPMIENKPVYDRPDYTPPDYAPPHLGLDPVRKPTYEKPLYILPSDNKPRYDLKYVEAPGYLAPTYNAPVYHAPNYVIKPYTPPAYDQRPAYDLGTIRYSRPEYEAPTYRPQEYLKPREVAPPIIKPPE